MQTLHFNVLALDCDEADVESSALQFYTAYPDTCNLLHSVSAVAAKSDELC